MMFKNILILVLASIYMPISIFASGQEHHRHHRVKHNCSEPNDEYLELLYSKYTTEFREYEADLFRSYINNTKKPDDTESKFDRKEFINEGSCELSNPNQAKFAKRPFCPWFYILYERRHKYPRFIVQSKCSCSDCSRKSKHIFRSCTPVFESVPVLERSWECDSYGFYKYFPATELRSVACVCTTYFPLTGEK